MLKISFTFICFIIFRVRFAKRTNQKLRLVQQQICKREKINMSEEDGENFLIMDNLRMEKESRERQWNRRIRSVLLQLFVFVFGLLSLTFLLMTKFPLSSSSDQNLTGMTTSSEINFSLDAKSVVVLESRSAGYEEVKSKNLLPWDLIVEPNRANIVSISKFFFNRVDVNIHEEDYHIVWSIGDEEYYGPSFQLELSDVGVRKGGVKIFRKVANDVATSSDMELLFSKDITVAVKYVRREIRSLTEADRNKFLKALRIMYSTTQEDGNKRYGSSFLSAETILLTHLTSAGMTDCDHWHDGAGFVTHHIAFTLLVEQSIQAIDPSLAMPYWDYALDGGRYTAETVAQSEVFQPDWFGEASPSNSDHRINDGGFWSEISFPDGDKYVSDWDIAATGSLNPHVNGYGLMRSPWNNNPSQFIGRRNSTYGVKRTSLPSCKDFKRCFLKATLKEMKFEFNGLTHGPVHILLGGAWGEDPDVFHQTITDRKGVTRPVDDNLDYLLQGPIKVVMFKLLWRMGYTRCPQTCPDLPAPCRCSVPQRFLDDFGARKILQATNISEYLSMIPQYKAHADDDEYLYKVLRALEDPGIVGDMLTSAAAYDPIFWPLHGTVERLLAYKRTVVRLGLGPAQLSDFNEDWGFPEFKIANNDPYLNGVCDWSKVKGPTDLTLPTCSLGASCVGHGEKDVIRLFELSKKKDMEFTNRGFYEYIRPWNDDLSYIYHSYDFDYCSEQGYSFLE